MKTTTFFTIAFLVSFFSASAQKPSYVSNTPPNAVKGVIRGVVKAENDKSAVEYANITVYSLPDSALVNGTITAPDGSFTLKNLPEGKYFLTADFIGYSKKTIPGIEINNKRTVVDFGDIFLEQANQNLETVEVVGEKNQVTYKIDKKVINIGKKLDAVGGTVVDALQNTPSVQVDQDGNLLLRGSSSYTVLIDGKPTALKGSDALKQIPASAVENVEVITNPSAKYDPDGTSGIINVIMKKDYKTGLNGIVNASAGTSFRSSQIQTSEDFTINYRTEKVNYFAGGSYAVRPDFPESVINSESFYKDTLHTIQLVSDRQHKPESYSIKAGADFYLTESDNFSISGDYGFWGFNMNMDTKASEDLFPESPSIYTFSRGKLNIGGHYVNGNASYTRKLTDKGHEITGSFVYSNWDGSTESSTFEQPTNNLWLATSEANHHKTLQNNSNNEYRFKLDYTLPIGQNAKFEAGYQGQIKASNADFSRMQYDFGTEIWENDAFYLNEMTFDRNIQSIYSTYGGSLYGIEYQLGVRGEYTDQVLHQITNDKKYTYNKFDIFPTLHFSKQLPAEQQLQMSYSRRINRPEEWDLNPYPIYSDQYVSQAGNPDLKPEYIDSYELNYMKRFKFGFASINGYYKETKNSFARTIFLNDDGIALVGTHNLGRDFAYGAELSSNIQIGKSVNIFAKADIYSYNISGDVVSETADKQSFNTDFVLNMSYSFLKTAKAQLTGFYNAPTTSAQGTRSEMYAFNLAVSNDFFNRKLTVALRGNDIFQTMKFKFSSEAENFKTNFAFNPASPTITLSLSYKINNYRQRMTDPEMQTGPRGGGVL